MAVQAGPAERRDPHHARQADPDRTHALDHHERPADLQGASGGVDASGGERPQGGGLGLHRESPGSCGEVEEGAHSVVRGVGVQGEGLPGVAGQDIPQRGEAQHQLPRLSHATCLDLCLCPRLRLCLCLCLRQGRRGTGQLGFVTAQDRASTDRCTCTTQAPALLTSPYGSSVYERTWASRPCR